MARVLVIDDEPDIRLLADVVLTRAGHDVEQAVDGPSGLARLERPPRPDVVVLDVRMPGVDGLAVLKEIGPDGPPVVLVTADPLALRAGARWTLAKPYRPEELVAAVAAALGSTSP
jgi:two-component system OmpR family response regulator